MNAETALAGTLTAPTLAGGGDLVLAARGIEKSYRRGTWPARRHRSVLRGADLDLYSGEVEQAHPDLEIERRQSLQIAEPLRQTLDADRGFHGTLLSTYPIPP